MHLITTIFTSFAVLLQGASEGRVCGHFCGAGWCANASINEMNCDINSVLPEAFSCQDNCCFQHDLCCQRGSRQLISRETYLNCNKEMIDCLDLCNSSSVCTGPHGSDFKANEISSVMKLAASLNLCCGTEC